MTLQIPSSSCPNKQYNVCIKMVRITILYLWDLHNLENALVESYFPKTEITSFTRAVNIVLCQSLRIDKLNERRNRSFRA